MFYVVLVIHCSLCAALIGLVLLQQGKGAEAGVAMGTGASNTVFGAAGAADFITKLTTSLAIAFMVTSVILVRAYQSDFTRVVTTATDPLAGSVVEDLEEVMAPGVAIPATQETTTEGAAPEAAAGSVGEVPAAPVPAAEASSQEEPAQAAEGQGSGTATAAEPLAQDAEPLAQEAAAAGQE